MREQLKVDLLPTYENAESLTTLIEAELEDNLNLNPTGTPKVKTLNTNDERKGKAKTDPKARRVRIQKAQKEKTKARVKSRKGDLNLANTFHWKKDAVLVNNVKHTTDY